MYEYLNTLYATTPGTVLRLDQDTVRVVIDQETRARLPLVRLQAIVVFGGQVTVTTPLLHRCAEDGRDIAWLTEHGRFRARITGTAAGNVLLRRAQHRALDDPAQTYAIARQFVAGKIQNARSVLLRSARDTDQPETKLRLQDAAGQMAELLGQVRDGEDGNLNRLRGMEGAAARVYFTVFPQMLRTTAGALTMNGRTRRPPRDRVNALLSFLYALLRGECEAAAEGVGLDPQVGFLHTLRPGRPALALDIMEELRPAVADRLALRLINRRQLRGTHFEDMPGGAVNLTEQGRRTALDEYQRLKSGLAYHRTLKDKVPVGMIPHLQARLLARHLRGDLAHYIPHLTS